jgi:hypothetical protein
LDVCSLKKRRMERERERESKEAGLDKDVSEVSEVQKWRVSEWPER